ncbi:MAG: hypothetical protein GF401_08130 [Chitinivibrionales bacterium]|nr:hypothetical protein [Chitinivibrionales bacterium]
MEELFIYIIFPLLGIAGFAYAVEVIANKSYHHSFFDDISDILLRGSLSFLGLFFLLLFWAVDDASIIMKSIFIFGMGVGAIAILQLYNENRKQTNALLALFGTIFQITIGLILFFVIAGIVNSILDKKK